MSDSGSGSEDSRANPIRFDTPGYPDLETNHFELRNVEDDSVIMVPSCYQNNWSDTDDCPWKESTDARRCWKVSHAYEILGAPHPRIVRYKGSDEWTELPLFEKPSGPGLAFLLLHHHELIYAPPLDTTACRPRPEFLPLIYQWSLHALTALSFCHSRDLLLGFFDINNFWLSKPDLSLSFVGFTSATFVYGPYRRRHSDYSGFFPFHPLQPDGLNSDEIEPTVNTDLVTYGVLIYQLMTTFWPGEGSNIGLEVVDLIKTRSQWPRLENKYRGQVVIKCWAGEYKDTQELRAGLAEVLSTEGWEIEGDDTLRGFSATGLIPFKEVYGRYIDR
ncbi:hypothetical protein EDB81DRAFT_768984 [Dactylonectria macrodidyma]|uniref:Protein kinase domain-containing protein n=1 Tax=Dactylonectria macrodidyma TaxID=307937 RepID=A0A9P9D0C1_9HYPO|nr:hypothetical protein EDB81DRAFT_768984 [Dactylonectria macrodidyma]